MSYLSQEFPLLSIVEVFELLCFIPFFLSCPLAFLLEAFSKQSHCWELGLAPFKGIIIAVEQLEGTFVVLFFLSLTTLLKELALIWFDNNLGTDVGFSFIEFASSVWRQTSTCLEISFCFTTVFSKPTKIQEELVVV